MKSFERLLGLVTVVCLIGAVPVRAAVYPEPIARAAKGQLQCYAPNPVKKTCAALVSFKPGPNGTFQSKAAILITPSPLVVMKGAAVVVAKGGKLCGRLSQRNFDEARFSDGDTDLAPMQSRFLRTVLAASAQSYFGREICGAYVPNGRAILVTPDVDGAAVDVDPQTVIWVKPEENFRVGR
jgi:hypothetical protein